MLVVQHPAVLKQLDKMRREAIATANTSLRLQSNTLLVWNKIESLNKWYEKEAKRLGVTLN